MSASSVSVLSIYSTESPHSEFIAPKLLIFPPREVEKWRSHVKRG